MLIPTRLWTSFSHTRFLKRRHKSRIDTLFCLMDIIFSTGSMFSFIAYSDLRAYNIGLTVVEGFFAVFYLAAMIDGCGSRTSTTASRLRSATSSTPTLSR